MVIPMNISKDIKIIRVWFGDDLGVAFEVINLLKILGFKGIINKLNFSDTYIIINLNKKSYKYSNTYDSYEELNTACAASCKLNINLEELKNGTKTLKVDTLEHEVKVKDGAVEVGCQKISYDDFEKIVQFVSSNIGSRG